MKNIFVNLGKKYLLVVVLGFFLSPFFALVLHPEKDFRYHLLNSNKPEVITGETYKNIKDNSYVTINGTIDLDSLVVTTGFLGADFHSCTFRLNGFPKNLILFSRHGALWERLKESYTASKSYTNITDSILRHKNLPGQDTIPMEVLQELDSQSHFAGRIYVSTGIFEEFESYYYRNELNLSRYFETIGESFYFQSLSSRAIQKAFPDDNPAPDQVYYLLVNEEKPSAAYIANTNLGVFLFIFGVMAIVVFWLAFIARKNKQNKVGDLSVK